jgi:hypothetical protein
MTLNAEEILKAEWDYIKGTASEAQEDRARVSTFFLGSAASLVAVLVGAKAEEFTPMIYYGFATLLFLMGITGWLTLGHLIRLRAAWYESILALNLIKEYYFHHFQGTGLENAFSWRVGTTSEEKAEEKRSGQGLILFKPWSVSFLFALQVALMTAVMFAGSLVCICLGLCHPASCCSIFIAISIAIGLLVGTGQMGVYYWRLTERENAIISAYEEKKKKIPTQ